MKSILKSISNTIVIAIFAASSIVIAQEGVDPTASDTQPTYIEPTTQQAETVQPPVSRSEKAMKKKKAKKTKAAHKKGKSKKTAHKKNKKKKHTT